MFSLRMRYAIAFLLAAMTASISEAEPSGAPMPAFTHTNAQDWLNSPPLSWTDLRGKVVLLEFWTFACSNCRGSIAWLRAVEEKYGGQGLRMVGVHTPELPQEYDRANVISKVAEYGLTNPQMLDNDYSYWNAMSNQYWPAFYLVDRKGHLREAFFGETHKDDRQAQSIESSIERLLAEPG